MQGLYKSMATWRKLVNRQSVNPAAIKLRHYLTLWNMVKGHYLA